MMLVGVDKASEMLGISAYALRRWIAQGVIPAINVGSVTGGRTRWRLNLEAVATAIEARSEAERAAREAAAESARGWR